MIKADEVLLTIAIPTYNRNKILKQNLFKLLPQLTSHVHVTIYDNFSDVPVTETLKEELEKYKNLKIFRNKANVGVSGNVIKCIEECESKWIWLLSDDDPPFANAIEIVLKYLFLYPNVNNINFKSNFTHQRKDDFLTKGQNEFLEKIDSIDNFFLISINVYNVENIKSHLRFAYIFSYTIVPHFVLLLVSLLEKNTVVFANQEIVISDNTYEGLDQRWSALPLCLGLPLLFELPIDVTKKNRRRLIKLILPIIGRPLSSLFRIAQLYDKKENVDIWKYNFEQPYLRIPTEIPFIWRIELWICKSFFIFPFLIPPFLSLVKRVKKILNRKTTAPVSDRFNRI